MKRVKHVEIAFARSTCFTFKSITFLLQKILSPLLKTTIFKDPKGDSFFLDLSKMYF